MKRKIISSIIKGSLMVILGLGSGYIGTSYYFDEHIEKRVSDEYQKQAQKFRSEFHILSKNLPAEIPESFSKKEYFVNVNKDDYWSRKVGFMFRFGGELKQRKIKESDIVKSTGTEYLFSIEEFFGIREELRIRNYSDTIFPESTIIIEDHDHDNIPDRIYLTDSINNSSISISRTDEGYLEIENIEEKGAKQLFDYYTYRYQRFKSKHSIDNLIAVYEPLLEIREYRISANTE